MSALPFFRPSWFLGAAMALGVGLARPDGDGDGPPDRPRPPGAGAGAGGGSNRRDDDRPGRQTRYRRDDRDDRSGEPPPPPPPPPPFGPPHPLMIALDKDRDGTLSRDEIADAPKALKALDKDEDGELSRRELRPPGPPPGDDRGPRARPGPSPRPRRPAASPRRPGRRPPAPARAEGLNRDPRRTRRTTHRAAQAARFFFRTPVDRGRPVAFPEVGSSERACRDAPASRTFPVSILH